MASIVKLGAVIIIILIGLTIFAPGTADDITGKISETTGIDKSLLDNSLGKASDFVKDNAEDLKEKAIDKAVELKSKAEEKIN